MSTLKRGPDGNNIKPINIKYNVKKKRYYVDESGQVYWKDIKGNYRKMKPFTTRDGYIEYVLTRTNGTKQHIQAQIIVLATFKGYSTNKEKIQVNHKDGDRKHNVLTNLEWVTPSENIKHSFSKLGKKVWNSTK